MENQQSNKKRIVWLALIVLTGFILIWLWSFLHTGMIVITTSDSNNSITLRQLISDSQLEAKPKTYKGSGKLSEKLKLGQYVVSVEGGSKSTVRLISLGSHRTVNLKIDPQATTGTQTVIYRKARNLLADGSQLTYLDDTDGKLYKIDNSNNFSTYGSGVFDSVIFVTPTSGVGQDNSGHLYQIKNGLGDPISVPFQYSGQVRFDVSSDGKLYVANGPDIYAGSLGGGLKKIYSADSSNLVIAAGSSGVAIASSKLEKDSKSVQPTLYIVSSDGKTIKKTRLTGDIREMDWSPDGKALSIANETSASIYSYDLKDKKPIPASGGIGNMTWFDNGRLYYSSNDQLWVYDPTSQQANLIANMPLASQIDNLKVSTDKSYLYVSTFGSASLNNFAIRRVGLKNQLVDKTIYQLQSILPLQVGRCDISFLNFTQPTILSFPISGESAQTCVQTSYDELSKRGFDMNRLSIKSSDLIQFTE